MTIQHPLQSALRSLFAEKTVTPKRAPQLGYEPRRQLQAVLGNAWQVETMPAPLVSEAIRLMEQDGEQSALQYVQRSYPRR